MQVLSFVLPNSKLVRDRKVIGIVRKHCNTVLLMKKPLGNRDKRLQLGPKINSLNMLGKPGKIIYLEN